MIETIETGSPNVLELQVEDPAMAHFLHHFHSHLNPAQAEKIRQQETDPSNNW